MSMRVERSSLDQVKKRFEVNKKKLEEKQKEYDFEERMKELREEVSVEIEVNLQTGVRWTSVLNALQMLTTQPNKEMNCK